MKDWRFLFHKYVLGGSVSEAPVKRLLRQLPKGDVFVDVGANLGDYSLLLQKKFRLTIAVEPHPATMRMLQKRVDGSRIVTVESALCEFDGKTMLYLDHDGARCDGSADTIQPVFNYRPPSSPGISKIWREESGVFVRAQRLDSLLGAFVDRDYRVDLVKIDVEGAEFRVLEGASGSLKHRIKRVVVELHDRERKDELENVLLDHGFFTHWIDLDHIYGGRTL